MNKSLRARAFVGIAFIITLIILSILANMIGWYGGAEKILIASLVLVGTIPRGTFFTE
jgi:hypothetical protein